MVVKHDVLKIYDHNQIEDTVNVIVNSSLENLGAKYFLNMNFDLNKVIFNAFQDCVHNATEAFVYSFVEKVSNKPQFLSLLSFLKSPTVSQEIWHLLEPGMEYFDRGKLTKEGYSELSNYFEDIDLRFVYDAWGNFLKAFSFASRSNPALRDFLHASYEAGSFKVLSNIEDVLEEIKIDVSRICVEEHSFQQSIQEYKEELRQYRDWASTFKVS